MLGRKAENSKVKRWRLETMIDQIANIEDGLIHHGKQNNRVYVMKAPREDPQSFITKIEDLAAENEYEKIIAKVPDGIKEEFIQSGYDEEAQVPDFYLGEEDCFFVSKYMCLERKKVSDKKVIEQVLQAAYKNKGPLYMSGLKNSFVCRKAEKRDITAMAALYKKVFITYPFPIHEEAYIESTMDDHVIYFGVWHQDILIALSSSEVDWKSKNAEMTDFAVDPDYRGRNISSWLLQVMEQEMKKYDIRLAYTIARAVSYGMNCTFSKNGYDFAGTLYNNTHIASDIESMNVWYKKL
jgi:putative beta-lysine N-acetyltransferase